jgi:Domain of unknown function (DUF4351)
MTQFPHDQFTKEHLSELLILYGIIKASEKIHGEAKEIDLLFIPTTTVPTTPETLGLLGKLAQTICLFEVFRNPPKSEQIITCLTKLFEIQTKLLREKRAENKTIPSSELPVLWIITPTLSTRILKEFAAHPQPEWPSGMYFLAPRVKTGIILVHQLPKTPDTLWLRLLGRGQVQLDAINEVKNLPENDPYRENVLKLVYGLLALLKAKQKDNQNIDSKEQVVIMKLAAIFDEQLAQEKTLGKLEAIQQEINFILRLLTKKVGNLSPELEQQIRNLSLDKLEKLGEDLLDFTENNNLISWLENHSK